MKIDFENNISENLKSMQNFPLQKVEIHFDSINISGYIILLNENTYIKLLIYFSF